MWSRKLHPKIWSDLQPCLTVLGELKKTFWLRKRKLTVTVDVAQQTSCLAGNRTWLWQLNPLNVFVTEPWTGGSVRQHAVESGPEPNHCDHVGDVFGLLQRSERQSYNRETQSEFGVKWYLRSDISQCSLSRGVWRSRMVTFKVLLHLPEFPAGPVCEISPNEQNKAAAACSGQERLPAASRFPLGVQGAAAPHPAEDHAAQSRERHAESGTRLCGIITRLWSNRLNSFSSSSSCFLPAVCCDSWP